MYKWDFEVDGILYSRGRTRRSGMIVRPMIEIKDSDDEVEQYNGKAYMSFKASEEGYDEWEPL